MTAARLPGTAQRQAAHHANLHRDRHDPGARRHRSSAGRFAADVIRRFRDADGPSQARALAYQTVFITLSGFIGLVGRERARTR